MKFHQKVGGKLGLVDLGSDRHPSWHLELVLVFLWNGSGRHPDVFALGISLRYVVGMAGPLLL